MNKTVITVGFLLLTITSVLYFRFKGLSHEITEYPALAASEPRMILEDLGIYNYTNGVIDSFIAAKLAHFVEPNRMELYTSVRAVNYATPVEQSLRSGAAFVVLNTKDVTSLLRAGMRNQTKVTQIDFESDVRVVYNEDVLKTDVATYYEADTTLSSVSPMTLEGKNRTMRSVHGFKFNIDSGLLSISNSVNGTVQP